MKSRNYEVFKFYKDNRVINQGLVNRLKKSIMEIGYIKTKSILVNGNMLIIDGQHRYTACKELNIPIHYEITDIDYRKAVINLNQNQLVWRLQDYIHLHAENGIECYIKLLEFEVEHKLGISNDITIMFTAENGGAKNANKIRKGEIFKINPHYLGILEFINFSKNYLSFYKNKTYIAAVVNLFYKVDGSSIKRLKDNLLLIKQQAKSSDYNIIFENIINKRMRNKISI